MFKQRLYTALILIPFVLLAIFYAYSWMLAGILLLFVLLGAWEWAQLVPIKYTLNKILFVLCLIPAVIASITWPTFWLLAGILVWGLILLAVLTFPGSQKNWGFPVIIGSSCLLLLPLLASTTTAIYQQVMGRDLIVYLLFLIWAADVGAYLAGKRWGRHKLIPKVSPGKSIEGLAGGFLMAMIVAVAGHYYFKPQMAAYWYVLCGGVALVSVLGDLFISMLKRRCQLKDTGHIFPGHGGVLDRLDSLMAASPFFYLGLMLWPQLIFS